MAKKKYTEEELLTVLKEASKLSPEGYVTRDWYTENIKTPTVKTFQNYFGSWNDALLKADLPTSRLSNYTDEEIIASIRDFYLNHKDEFTSTSYFNYEYKPHIDVIFKRFKTWERACKASGIDLKVVKLEAKIEKMLKSLKSCKKLYGNTYVDTYKQSGLKPTYETIKRHYGSWEKAQREAGVL